MVPPASTIQPKVETAAILECVPDGVAVVDSEWRCIYVNKALEKLVGRTREEMVGQNCWALAPTAVGTIFEEQFRRAMAEQVSVEFEAFYLRLRIWVDVRAFPMSGNLTIFFRDISAKKRMERALRDSEDQHRAFFDLASVGLAIADPHTGRFLRVNQKLCEITGYRAEELLGMPFRDLTYPPDMGEDRKKFEAMLANPRSPYWNEKRYVRKDGTIIWVEVNSIAIRNEAGKPIRTTAVVRDITVRKQAQEALQAAKEQAEAANRAKDHFLAVLSHELRTPLTPVLTTAEILERDATLSPEQQEAIRMICRNVELEARLIDDLLNLTQITRGKMELSLATVDVHAHLQHVIAMCEGEISAKRLQLETRLGARIHTVTADASRLQQILWNLLKNAVKFTPAEGRITLRTDNPSGDQLRVVVQDSGIGIAPEDLPRLFVAFEQGSRGITREFGGLGLGLVISKGLTDLHGGTLVAESEGRGKGATFTLMLPTAVAARSVGMEAGAESPIQALARHRRVLLVEDHADTSKVMVMLLRRYGFDVTLARSVSEALAAAGSQTFDLIISDIGLPDGTGLDMMREVCATRQVRGIALSGYGMEEDVHKSKEAGFMAHLTKPVDLQTLEEVLRDVLPPAG